MMKSKKFIYFVVILTLIFSSLPTLSLAAQEAKQPAPQQASSTKININTADLGQLETLPGIGPAMAQNIIDHRTKVGPFKAIEEVKNVKGIGEKKFEKIKDLITL